MVVAQVTIRFALAEIVGPEGKVYAVDLGKKSIRALEKKAEKAWLPQYRSTRFICGRLELHKRQVG